jgi:hypothetical protein
MTSIRCLIISTSQSSSLGGSNSQKLELVILGLHADKAGPPRIIGVAKASLCLGASWLSEIDLPGGIKALLTFWDSLSTSSRNNPIDVIIVFVAINVFTFFLGY